MFSDDFMDNEDNAKIFDVIFQWMTLGNDLNSNYSCISLDNAVQFNVIDAEDPDVFIILF